MARTHLKDLEYITIDGVQIRQPDRDGFIQNWETTYTEDSGRVMSGGAQLDPMFTVESISVKWSNVWHDDVSEILKLILPRKGKPNFMLHYFSWYYNCWRDAPFYVGKGSLKVNQIQTYKAHGNTYNDYTKVENITCNLIGVEPIL